MGRQLVEAASAISRLRSAGRRCATRAYSLHHCNVARSMKPPKRRCTEKPAERLVAAVVSKPPRPPARYTPAVAITNQGSISQFGPHIAGAHARFLVETSSYAKPVRLEGDAFEIRLLAEEASASVKLEPFFDTDMVVRNVLTDMGATYMAGQRFYTVADCRVIGEHFVAPGYLERLKEDVIEKLSSVVVPSKPAMCVCLHREFLKLFIAFDDDDALMGMFQNSCNIVGGVLRRNRVQVVISQALFDMQLPITGKYLTKDRSQKAFNIVKSLEEESKVKVDVFGLFTCEGQEARLHELAKAAVDYSRGEVNGWLVEGGFDRGGHALLLVSGGSGRLPELLKVPTRFTKQKYPLVETADDLQKYLVKACFPGSDVMGSSTSNFNSAGLICSGVLNDAAALAYAGHLQFSTDVLRGCVVTGGSGISGLTVVFEEFGRRAGISVRKRAKLRKLVLAGCEEARHLVKRVVRAIQKEAGVDVEGEADCLRGGPKLLRWRKKLQVVWRPQDGESPLVGAQAVARDMGLPDPEKRGRDIVYALLHQRRTGSCLAADYDTYKTQFEVEEVTAADDVVVDLENDRALLARCVAAGVAEARAFKADLVRKRSGVGGLGGPGSTQGRGQIPSAGALFRGWPLPPPVPPAQPAPPLPAGPGVAPPPPPPDDSSSSSSDDDFNPNGADTSDSEPECG